MRAAAGPGHRRPARTAGAARPPGGVSRPGPLLAPVHKIGFDAGEVAAARQHSWSQRSATALESYRARWSEWKTERSDCRGSGSPSGGRRRPGSGSVASLRSMAASSAARPRTAVSARPVPQTPPLGWDASRQSNEMVRRKGSRVPPDIAMNLPGPLFSVSSGPSGPVFPVLLLLCAGMRYVTRSGTSGSVDTLVRRTAAGAGCAHPAGRRCGWEEPPEKPWGHMDSRRVTYLERWRLNWSRGSP